MPAPMSAIGLTGGRRYRKGWFGKLVLQVQTKDQKYVDYGRHVECETVATWRDATPRDLRGLAYLDARDTAREQGRAPPPPPDWSGAGF